MLSTFIDGGFLHSNTTKHLLCLPVLSLLTCLLRFFFATKTNRKQQPAKKEYQAPQKYAHKDKLFGFDLLWKCSRSINSHTFLQDTRSWITDSKSTFQYLVFGNKAVLTIDPENIKAILFSQFREFGLGAPRMHALQPLFGSGISNSEGESWHSSRTLLRKHLSRHAENEIPVFEKSVQKLVKLIPTDGTSIDLQELFSLLTLDNATELLLGSSTNSLDSTDAHCESNQFAQAFDYVQAYVSGIDDINIYSLLKKMFDKSRFHKSMAQVDQYIEHLIRKALEDSDSSNLSEADVADSNETKEELNLLQDLMQTYSDPKKVRNELLNVLLAAKDSTKTLMSNVWFLLARHPEVFNELRAEIAILDGRAPDIQQLKSLRFLDSVIKEALRLLPPVALNQRTAKIDTTIPLGAGPDGQSPMFVKQGTSVGYSVYALHRREDIYGADAASFRPSRWLDEGMRPGWAFLPFHGGPRKCPGQRLAVTQVAYVTVRLLQCFTQVTSTDPNPWIESLGLNCYSRNGVKVSFSNDI